MTPERFQQIEELYHAARESTADERAVLLAQTEPELRREIESLLAGRGRGDVEKYKHQLASWKTEVVGQLGKTQSFQYDSSGNGASRRSPDNGVLTYHYDPLNRLSTPTIPERAFDSLHKALQSISVHHWLLLGLERARLSSAASRPLTNSSRRMDE